MTTTVYVWENSPSDVGHVSVQVNNTYMSFWPKGAAKAKKDIKLGEQHEPSFPRGYRTDQRVEGRSADSTIVIDNLNETLMIEYWDDFRNKMTKYNMLESNCSTVVAAILEVGSGITPAHSPSIRIDDYVGNQTMRWFLKLRFLGNYIHMWTPNDVKIYALQIQSSQIK